MELWLVFGFVTTACIASVVLYDLQRRERHARRACDEGRHRYLWRGLPVELMCLHCLRRPLLPPRPSLHKPTTQVYLFARRGPVPPRSLPDILAVLGQYDSINEAMQAIELNLSDDPVPDQSWRLYRFGWAGQSLSDGEPVAEGRGSIVTRRLGRDTEKTTKHDTGGVEQNGLG